MENYKQYDTYSIVEYFKKNTTIDELAKNSFIKYQEFQNNYYYKKNDILIKYIFQNYVNSNIAHSMFYKIRKSKINYKKYFHTQSFIDDLYNSKILFSQFF